MEEQRPQAELADGSVQANASVALEDVVYTGKHAAVLRSRTQQRARASNMPQSLFNMHNAVKCATCELCACREYLSSV